MFDDRTALSDLFQYDGDKGGDAWRTRVRGYFIGCCPEMAGWLDWAEGAPGKTPQRTDEQAVTIADTTERATGMGEESGVILSGHVWKFLQICCRCSANTTFQAVTPELNGLEVWRALVWEINSGRSTRMLTLREEVHRPTPVRDYRLVSTAISRYDVTLSNFVAAGGTKPSDDELKHNFLKSLPQDLREALLLKATEASSYDHFKHHVRTKVAFILHCRGETAAHSMEAELSENILDENIRERIGEDAYEEILAIARGRPGQRSPPGRRSSGPSSTSSGPRTRPPGGPTRAPGRSDADVRCGNCGKKGHPTRECRQPHVDPSERLCFRCLKPGHQSRQCREAPSTDARTIEGDDKPVYALSLLETADEEGFTRVGRPIIPRPAGATIGDAIDLAFKELQERNRYRGLREDSGEEEEGWKTVGECWRKSDKCREG